MWLDPAHSLFFLWQYWYRFRYKKYFDTIEKFPLTVKQRQSIIVDEKRNLIIAGAGTGKTSTVVGKVGFLVKSGRAKPDEILAIAYNRNAAQELKDRIKDKANIEIDVGTFHSIGKSILAQSKYPSRPHEFVEQEEKLEIFLMQILNKCLKISDFADAYFEYFKKFEFRNVDEIRDFKSEREYANWLRSNKLITLNNERVKSHGELLIANFLFSNGIEYKYENYYSAQNSMPVDFDYRPDFYLPKQEIYIEYFGIDREGNTAPFVPKDQYHADMKWKFDTHRQGNTKLIDLYFHQKKSGDLLTLLKDRLKSHSVEFNPISNKDLFKVINNTEKDVRFLKLVQRFLGQFKERQNSIALSNLVNKWQHDDRTSLFLKLFRILLNAYQSELAKDRKIDFGDMISQSAKLVRQNAQLSKYKYIIIDEFQDISDGRYDLISQFLKQNERTKLFCVGDDWQAIYRFAGSDHKIMTNFEKLFGASTTLKLDQTFRYNDQVASVSEQFIIKNPSQIKKNIRALSSKTTPQVFVHWHQNASLDALRVAIQKIKENYDISAKSLLLLSRYNHNQLSGEKLEEVKHVWQGGAISQRSVHSSKGLEADFVIVLDLMADHFGFPSEIQDDPLLGLVLANEDDFLDSEERRLMYVALTRTKHQVHLISDASCPSRFAQELASGNYNVFVTGDQNAGKKCPACSDGVLIKKSGELGDYYSCYNFPVCKFKPLTCPECNEEIVLRQKDKHGDEIAICQSESCKNIQECCDRCDKGVFQVIQGKRGPFWGCHDFPRSKCKGTKKIVAEKQNSLFETWVTIFRTHLTDSLFSSDVKFFQGFELKENINSFDVLISFEIDKQKRDFMKISVNLDVFEIQIENALTSPIDKFTFDDEQNAFMIIDNEIEQRRILFGITHPADSVHFSVGNRGLEVVTDEPRYKNLVRKQDLNSSVIDSKHTEMMKPSDDLNYFKIEEFSTITPLNENHKFIREGILYDKEKISELRKDNDNQGRLLHHGFPLTLEEKDLILKMYNQGKTKIELERYFQRSRITIAKTIEKYT